MQNAADTREGWRAHNVSETGDKGAVQSYLAAYLLLVALFSSSFPLCFLCFLSFFCFLFFLLRLCSSSLPSSSSSSLTTFTFFFFFFFESFQKEDSQYMWRRQRNRWRTVMIQAFTHSQA